jgi:hypothetical protein
MTGLNSSLPSETNVHFNGYLSDVNSGVQTIVPLDIELEGLKATAIQGGIKLTADACDLSEYAKLTDI